MRKMAEACVDPLALLGGDCKDDVLRFAFYTGMGVRMQIMLYRGVSLYHKLVSESAELPITHCQSSAIL